MVSLTTEARSQLPSPVGGERLDIVLDQGLNFGAWQARNYNGFAHRVEWYNTSRTLTDFVESGIKEYSAIIPLVRRERARKTKTSFSLTIGDKVGGIDFLENTVDQLHLKQGFARAYQEFLKSLIDDREDAQKKYEDFKKMKRAIFDAPVLYPEYTQIQDGVIILKDPSKETTTTMDIYIPDLPNLAARLDTDGFIGLQPKNDQPLRSPSPEVRLGTHFLGLAVGLKEGYKGSIVPRNSYYYWSALDDVAIGILRKVFPHLKNMREQAQFVLEYDEVDKKLNRRGLGSKTRDQLLQLLGLENPKYHPLDILFTGYVEKSRQINANPA